MNKLGVDVLGVQGRGGEDGAVILKDGVTLRVTATEIIAFDVKSEFLARFIGGNRARDDIGDGILAV